MVSRLGRLQSVIRLDLINEDEVDEDAVTGR